MKHSFLDTEAYRALRIDLVEIIHLFHSRGWSAATSTNYSFRNPKPNEATYTISRSGVDKLKFSVNDFMLIDRFGNPLAGYEHLKSSAETLLHTLLYEIPETQCILHTHSQASTVFSLVHQKDKIVKLTGFELLKALHGVDTHEAEVFIPVFDNSQDMKTLSEEIHIYYEHNPDMLGFLLAGHGLYAWGNSIAEAKRHVEALEFIFECMLQMYGLCRVSS
jgi:methylthioribulose-1-phosphate dehydratase